MTKLLVWVRVAVALSLVSGAIAMGLPVEAQEEGAEPQPLVVGQPSLAGQRSNDQGQITNDFIPQLSESDQPATTVEDWIAQIEAARVQITRVRVETTDAGLQVILETAEGELSVTETRTVGNALIADIENARSQRSFLRQSRARGLRWWKCCSCQEIQCGWRLPEQTRRL